MGIKSQQGAIGIWIGVVLLSLVLFASLAIDTARLYYQQQELQSIADIAALKVSRANPYFINPVNKAELESQIFNEYKDKVDSVGLRYGQAKIVDNRWVVDFNNSSNLGYSAAQVTVSRKVPESMIASGFFNNRFVTLNATAAIQKTGLLQFGIGSRTLGLGTGTATNSLLGALLGKNIDLEVASYKGLANSSIHIGEVLSLLQVELNVGSVKEVLETNVDLLTILNVYAKTLYSGDPDNLAVSIAAIQEILSLQTELPDIMLGQILNLKTQTEEAALQAELNAFDLLMATIYVANEDHFINIPLNLNLPGVIDLGVGLNVISAPEFTLSTLPIIEGFEPRVKNAQIALKLGADLEVLDLLSKEGLIGKLASVDISPLNLSIEASSAEAMLRGLNFHNGQGSAEFQVRSSLLALNIEPLKIDVAVLGLGLLGLEVSATSVDLEQSRTDLLVDLNSVQNGEPIHIRGQLLPDLDLKLRSTGLVGILLQPILSLLSPLLELIINNIVNSLVSDAVLPILSLVGVEVAGADLWIDSMNANSHGLIR